jgi:phage antirepressor YoqD-like protein
VYKLSKALYGLKHAPWAWYTRLKTFLPEHGYVMRSVDKTLFTLKLGNVRLKTFLLEHGYVIGSVDKTLFTRNRVYLQAFIFGGSSHTLVSSF